MPKKKVETWKKQVGKTVVGRVVQVSDTKDVCVDVAKGVRGVLRADRRHNGAAYKIGDQMVFLVVSVGKDPESHKGVLLWLSGNKESISSSVASGMGDFVRGSGKGVASARPRRRPAGTV